MKNDQYFKHDAGASGNQKVMGLIDELGMKGYGTYWLLLETLRMQKKYRAPLNIVRRLSRRARVMPSYLLRVIRNFDLFVVEADSFYSPGMMRRMHPYDVKTTPALHEDYNLEDLNSLENRKNPLPNAREEEKKERRKKEEEKETPPKLTPRQVRDVVNVADHWEQYIDEAFGDRAWLEVVAMHSGMGAQFMERLPAIVRFFKQHVRTYGKEETVCSAADAKSYFGNFVRQHSPTQKALLAELTKQSARRAADNPYRYEEHDPQTGQRMYCGLVIPADAPPRPHENAVWSETLREWS
ncbi:DUF7833 domain-containing protein [Bacteroides sp.]